MVKKGVSADEKRKRALEFFWEQKSIFSLKELESQLSKQKGIVSQSVKEVVQGLVDDELVDSDKIGSGNFYWSFPSKATRKRESKLESLRKAVTETKAKSDELESKKRKSYEGRGASDERAAKMAKLTDLRAQRAEIDEKLSKFTAFDPEKIQQLLKSATACKDAANRWTDGIQIMWSYFKEKSGGSEMTEEQFLQHFGLAKDLDTLP